jgi:hypothetical protein
MNDCAGAKSVKKRFSRCELQNTIVSVERALSDLRSKKNTLWKSFLMSFDQVKADNDGFPFFLFQQRSGT